MPTSSSRYDGTARIPPRLNRSSTSSSISGSRRTVDSRFSMKTSLKRRAFVGTSRRTRSITPGECFRTWSTRLNEGASRLRWYKNSCCGKLSHRRVTDRSGIAHYSFGRKNGGGKEDEGMGCSGNNVAAHRRIYNAGPCGQAGESKLLGRRHLPAGYNRG